MTFEEVEREIRELTIMMDYIRITLSQPPDSFLYF